MDRNQNLQNVAAAVYNYDIYNEEDEKVYEASCYVTFSSKFYEVCIQFQLEFMYIYCLLIDKLFVGFTYVQFHINDWF